MLVDDADVRTATLEFCMAAAIIRCFVTWAVAVASQLYLLMSMEVAAVPIKLRCLGATVLLGCAIDSWF